MIGPLLFLAAAAAATDFGPSPLVPPGHASRWTVAEDNEEITGWLDEAWRGETVIEGVRYKQVLVRSAVKGSEQMVIDGIAIVDCAGRRLGMQRLYMIKSSQGNNMEVPLDGLELSAPEDESADGIILEFACGTGAAR